MAITRWTPLREMRDLQREMSRVFGRPFVSMFDQSEGKVTGIGPAMDIFSRGNDLVVRIELPGVKAEDLDIQLVEHSLIIKGERKEEKEIKEEDYFRRESSYGSFERMLPVPEKITETDIEASYEGGILEVMVKGAVEEEPVKRIEVKTKGEKQAIEPEGRET